MGACEFTTSARGKSFNEAYNRAYQEAEDEHGHEEGYSGAINSASSPRDITSQFKASKKTIHAFIEMKMENASKRDCWGVCVEEPKTNTNKIKTVVEHIVTPGTKKWVLNYVAYSFKTKLGSFKTKGAAVTHARKHTEKTQERTSIVLEKTLEKGNSIVARISYKPSKDEKQGKWIFFGLAPE